MMPGLKAKAPYEDLGNGIVVFKGKLARNALMEAMVSNAYVLDDEETLTIYDPSCGKDMAQRIERYLAQRRRQGSSWEKALVVAGHSHMDHAGNLYLAEVAGARQARILVHEAGFFNGKVFNEPALMFEKLVSIAHGYFNRYRSFSFPASLLLMPFLLMDRVLPNLTRKVFGRLASLAWPGPVNGSLVPESLRDQDLIDLNIEGVELRGWRLENKMVIPSPGHSPCSVSLFWPGKRALFVSDADWIGNPVFMFSSIGDCISSLQTFRDLTRAGLVDCFLPAHGLVKSGKKCILSHLRFHIGRLEAMRDDVLAVYRTHGEKDVYRLARLLVRESPLLKSIQLQSTPRMVANVYDTVAICLREAGILR